ncbi:MAG TPA: MFS transporter [Firmicutes bacterium]|nr:MFS transporter [Bacillota bacterium]
MRRVQAECEARRKRGWMAFVLLALAYLIVMFQRFAPGAISNELANELMVSNTALGALGSAYFYPYAILQIPCGGLSDSVGPRRILLWSLIAQSVGSIWFAQARSFQSAFLGRLLVGFGASFVYVSALKVLAEVFAREQFPVFVGLLQAVGNLGAVLASVPLISIAGVVGWRAIFAGVACLTALLAPVSLCVIGDSAEKHRRYSLKTASGGFYRFVRSRFLIGVGLWMFCFSGTKLAFQGLWAARYLTQAGGLTPREVGIVLLLFGLGGVVGSPLYGWVAQRLRTNEGTMLVGSFLLSLFWIVLFVVGRPIRSWAFYFSMGLVSGVFTLAFACTKDRSPAGFFATIVGVVNAWSFAGSVLFIQLSGSVVDAVLRRTRGDWVAAFRAVFGLSAVSMIIASGTLLILSRLELPRVAVHR